MTLDRTNTAPEAWISYNLRDGDRVIATIDQLRDGRFIVNGKRGRFFSNLSAALIAAQS